MFAPSTAAPFLHIRICLPRFFKQGHGFVLYTSHFPFQYISSKALSVTLSHWWSGRIELGWPKSNPIKPKACCSVNWNHLRGQKAALFYVLDYTVPEVSTLFHLFHSLFLKGMGFALHNFLLLVMLFIA